MTSYAAVLQNTLKVSLASSVLAIDTLYFNLKRRKNVKIFVCAFGVPTNGRFFVRHAENVSFFVAGVLHPPPPMEKFLRAPMVAEGS